MFAETGERAHGSNSRITDSTDLRLRFFAAVALLLFAIATLFMPLSQSLDAGGNVATACEMGQQPPGTVVSETSLVVARVTTWPAGRYCQWHANGGGMVHLQTGWFATSVGVMGSAAGAVLIAWLVWRSARRKRGTRSVTAMTAVAVLMFVIAWALTLAGAYTSSV